MGTGLGLERVTELDRAKLGSARLGIRPFFTTGLARLFYRAELQRAELERASGQAEKLARTSSPNQR